MTWIGGELTVQRDTYGRNTILYTGVGGGSHTLTRTTTYMDGRVATVPVAGGVNVPGAQPDVWVDGDVPFGDSVTNNTYTLGSSTVVVPPEARKCGVLSNPHTGVCTNIVGSEIGDRIRPSATSVTWLDVTVNAAPSVHARPEQAPMQVLTFFTTSRFARETVDALMARRQPLCLRTPHSGFDDLWFIVEGERPEARDMPHFADEEWRVHTWAMVTVPRPDPAAKRHALHNLGELAQQGATLGDLAAQWPTLGEMAAAPLAAENTEGLP